jgi:hypothetical protein
VGIVNSLKETGYNESIERLARCLAQNLQKHSDVAWLIEAWPSLPETTRKQIIDTVQAALKRGGATK